MGIGEYFGFKWGKKQENDPLREMITATKAEASLNAMVSRLVEWQNQPDGESVLQLLKDFEENYRSFHETLPSIIAINPELKKYLRAFNPEVMVELLSLLRREAEVRQVQARVEKMLADPKQRNESLENYHHQVLAKREKIESALKDHAIKMRDILADIGESVDWSEYSRSTSQKKKHDKDRDEFAEGAADERVTSNYLTPELRAVATKILDELPSLMKECPYEVAAGSFSKLPYVPNSYQWGMELHLEDQVLDPVQNQEEDPVGRSVHLTYEVHPTYIAPYDTRGYDAFQHHERLLYLFTNPLHIKTGRLRNNFDVVWLYFEIDRESTPTELLMYWEEVKKTKPFETYVVSSPAEMERKALADLLQGGHHEEFLTRKKRRTEWWLGNKKD